MRNLLWNLFKKTGNIKYYLMYNELKDLGDNNEGEHSWDSTK